VLNREVVALELKARSILGEPVRLGIGVSRDRPVWNVG
jgi:hypothetical protein